MKEIKEIIWRKFKLCQISYYICVKISKANLVATKDAHLNRSHAVQDFS